jgi:hypothetical protein
MSVRTSGALARSFKNGTNSIRSRSLGSSNQLSIGMAFSGWNKYDAAELSMMIMFFKSRPIRPKSYTQKKKEKIPHTHSERERRTESTNESLLLSFGAVGIIVRIKPKGWTNVETLIAYASRRVPYLDIGSLVVLAMLAEQSPAHDLVLVQ